MSDPRLAATLAAVKAAPSADSWAATRVALTAGPTVALKVAHLVGEWADSRAARRGHASVRWRASRRAEMRAVSWADHWAALWDATRAADLAVL